MTDSPERQRESRSGSLRVSKGPSDRRPSRAVRRSESLVAAFVLACTSLACPRELPPVAATCVSVLENPALPGVQEIARSSQDAFLNYRILGCSEPTQTDAVAAWDAWVRQRLDQICDGSPGTAHYRERYCTGQPWCVRYSGCTSNSIPRVGGSYRSGCGSAPPRGSAMGDLPDCPPLPAQPPGAPVLGLDRDDIDFGTVTIGAQRGESVRVRNAGGGGLVL